MKGEWLRAFGFFFVLTFLALVAWAALPRLLGAASGPEGELLTLIKAKERDGLRLDIPGMKEPLRSTEAHYDRITITVGPDGKTAEAVATLDFTGGVEGMKVSSLGYEKIQFELKDHEWQLKGSLAPRLTRIVSALERRRRLLETEAPPQPDAGVAPDADLAQWLSYTQRKVNVKAWYIRSERDEVLVTEDSVRTAVSPDRPIHETKTARLTMREADGEFFFPAGLL